MVNSTGPIKPVQSVSVGSFVSGPIQTIHVDFNSTVKKGQVLALIDPRLSDASLNREKAALATQDAELDRHRSPAQAGRAQEQRALNLRKTNIDYVSEQEMDQLQFAAHGSGGPGESRQGEHRRGHGRRSITRSPTSNYTKIVSPVDGIVIDRKVDPGQTVASSFQTPELFIIAPDMDKHMHVYASVDEADIGQIRGGPGERSAA